MLESLRRASQQASEIIRIFGNAVGYRTLQMIPNRLIGVKLRGVPRKEVRMNPGMVFKESLDRPGFVHTPSVPEKHESFSQVSQKISQEDQHLGMTDVLQGMKADVQGNPPFSGRNTDRGDGRDLRPSSGDLKNRGLSDRSPSLFDGRDQAEPALVEEDQRNFKPFGLFLYAATYSVSSALFPFHPVPGLWFRASDGSSPAPLESSKHDPDDKAPQSGHRSPWPLFPRSTGQWSSRFSKGLPQAFVQAPASGARLVSQAYPAPVSASRPSHLWSFANRSNNRPSLKNNRLYEQRPADSILRRVAEGPAADVLQAALGFHGVSWNQSIIFLLLMRDSIGVRAYVFCS